MLFCQDYVWNVCRLSSPVCRIMYWYRYMFMTSDSKIVNIPDICYMVSLGWIVSASGSLAIESIKYWISGKINSASITSFTRKKTLRHVSPTRRTGLKQTFVKLERKCAMKEMECKTINGDTTIRQRCSKPNWEHNTSGKKKKVKFLLP